MASPPATAAAPSAPSGAYAAPAPKPRSRTPVLIAVAVVVVIVVLVLALAVAGVLPLFGSNSNGRGGAQSFSSARASAESAAGSQGGGPWSVVYAIGVASPASGTELTSNLTSIFSSSGCTFTKAATFPSSVAIAATSNVGAGTPGNWVFVLKNSAGTSLLVVAVSGGASTLLGTLGGGTCSQLLGAVTPVAATVKDSTTAAATANAAGGAAFLSNYPNALSAMSIFGSISVLGFSTSSQWNITYQNCPLFPTVAATGQTFKASVDAATGALLSAHNSTTVCSAFGAGPSGGSTGGNPGGGGTGGSIAGAVSLGPSHVWFDTDTSTWFYNLTVSYSGTPAGLTFANLGVAVNAMGGSADSNAEFLSVFASASSTTQLAEYTFQGASWFSGQSTAVASGMVVQVAVGADANGDTLVLTGESPWSGTVTSPGFLG